MGTIRDSFALYKLSENLIGWASAPKSKWLLIGGVIIKLTDLPVKKTGIIIAIAAKGQKRRRLFDLGFIPGSQVRCIRHSPAGNPIAFLIRNTTIALRKEESDCIIVRKYD